jgi:ABC-type branched-subunit amino acid transport system ATPase component
MGAGRTELLECLFGLHAQECSGEVYVDGHQVSLRSPADAIAQGLALAPEDRKRDGLFLSMTVAENAGLASLGRAEHLGFMNTRAEHEHVQGYLERFRVRASSLRQPVRNLSGGNQQEVVLAKWPATIPRVLLLDEPTRGIDIQTKQDIYSMIRELALDGLAVVAVSSELPEILTVSDRVLVLCEGRLTAEFSRDEATEESILHAALPRKPNAEGLKGLPGPFSVSHRAGAARACDESALRAVSHGGERLEHPAADLRQPLSVDRHDGDHPRGRDRPVSWRDPGAGGRSGGRGSVVGTVLGCLIIGVVNNGLFLLYVSPFWQQVVKGFVILAAVAIDKLSARET